MKKLSVMAHLFGVPPQASRQETALQVIRYARCTASFGIAIGTLIAIGRALRTE